MNKPVKWMRQGQRSPCAPRAVDGPDDVRPDVAYVFCHSQ